MENKYPTGALESTIDSRDFTFEPNPLKTLLSFIPWSGGIPYLPEDIENQEREGICTSISLSQQMRKVYGIDFSEEFQYLLQKKEYDKNWYEGSSGRASIWVATNIGLLPAKYWKYKISRKLPYAEYVEKLKAIPDEEIEKLKKKCIKAQGYQPVPVTRDAMAQAINQSEAGILVRFVVGNEWWTEPIEPLRPPKQPISGHFAIINKYTGGSFRVANTWGPKWADNGTAYFLLKDYQPTEAWLVHYRKTTKGFDKYKK